MANPQVMLITGTRKGIGADLAKFYTNEGYQVIGCRLETIFMVVTFARKFVPGIKELLFLN